MPVPSPPPAPAGTIALIVVALFTAYDVAAVEPKLTAVAPARFVPLIVTSVPLGPEAGLNEETVGTGGAALLESGSATPKVTTRARAAQAPRTCRVRVNTFMRLESPPDTRGRPEATDAGAPSTAPFCDYCRSSACRLP